VVNVSWIARESGDVFDEELDPDEEFDRMAVAIDRVMSCRTCRYP
jgi:hypothetical protein